MKPRKSKIIKTQSNYKLVEILLKLKLELE